jgi:hypothetical protein
VAKNDSGVVTISSPRPQPSAIAIATQRVGARAGADRAGDAGRGGQRPLEALDLGAADEAAVIEHPRDRGVDRRADRRQLAAHVEERDGGGHGSAIV